MTKEEAIEILQEERDYAQFPQYVKKAIKIATSAIEKQIPKKPTGIYDENESEKGKGLYEEALIGGCPVCQQEVQLGMKYCMNCGQALDFNSNGSDSK